MISVKIHQSDPKIIAICDAELIGKRFEDESRQIDINERFYRGEMMDEQKVKELIAKMVDDYCSFNIVGQRSIDVAMKVGIIDAKKIIYIKKIPVALVFNL